MSLEELRESLETVARAPSGYVYRVRRMNLQRHALAGGFPAKLRETAIRQALGQSAVADDDDNDLGERALELAAYFDEVVRQVIIEPPLATDADLELLPPQDFDWAVGIAMGTVTEDADGQPLWGGGGLARFREAAEQ